MNIVQKTISGIDNFQRNHKRIAFLYAIVKKYSDDQAGFQAALVTYYGFLSLFPLLLVLTTVAGMVGSNNPAIGKEIVSSVSQYFPVFGEVLGESVSGIGKSGLALVIGLLFTLYGARGIADAFRSAVNHIWHVPLARRSGFPRSWIRSFGIIFGGGTGFILASVITTWAGTAMGGGIMRGVSVVINIVLLYLIFMLILRLSLPLRITRQQFRLAAVVSAIGIALLQLIGVAVLTNQSDNLTSTYSALFATTLGLLAWIYLQAQVVMYANVIATVKNDKLWPRALQGDNPTKIDKLVKKRQETLVPTHYR